MEQLGLQRHSAASAFWFLTCFLAAGVPGAHAADRIVLRNLDVITDRTVVDFDVDGIRLDNQSALPWDEVESARIRADRQAEFDRQLAELGGPLFRIRQRLRVGDYQDVLSHAEPVYPRYRGRSSPTAYMVTQALMWGRLAARERERAVEPYLHCCVYLRGLERPEVELPGQRRLQFDARTGLTSDLLPIWFDRQAAADVLPVVFEVIAGLPLPRPEGAYIYYASLALAAGRPEEAERVLQAVVARDGPLAELKTVVAAQKETVTGNSGENLARLAASWQEFTPASQPLALYWLGKSRLLSSDADERARGVLFLLRIPALFGAEQPDLAGAALYEAMQALAELQDARGSVSVRNELLVRYGQTWHAARARSTEEAVEEAP
jgi:hypothetical protein